MNVSGECNERLEQSNCEMYCDFRQILDDCGCLLTSVPLNVINFAYSGERNCSLTDLNNCNWSKHIRNHCLATQCKPGCHDHFTYSMEDIDLKNVTFNSSATKLLIKSTFVANNYISYEQKYQYTWDVILATLGGTLQFWVGAGVVTFVHIALHAFDMVCLKNYSILFLF